VNTFLATIIAIPISAYRAWVLLKLWEWFAVASPLALPMVDFIHMWGLIVLISMLTAHIHLDSDRNKSYVWMYLIASVIRSTAAIVMGWTLSCFM
jgi:hypothetical protein